MRGRKEGRKEGRSEWVVEEGQGEAHYCIY